jgi:hypothetical protein
MLHSRPWTHKRLSPVAGLLAVTAIVVVAVFVVRSVGEARLRREAIACAYELHKLGQLALSLAAQHGGALPGSLHDLARQTGEPDIFASPFRQGSLGRIDEVDFWSDYRVVADCHTNDPARKVYMYLVTTNKGHVVRVELYVDGSVRPTVAGRSAFE